MTPEELAELKALDQAATPGPWEYDPESGLKDFYRIPEGVWSVAPGESWEECAANSALIVVMRNRLPGLLDQLQQLERDGKEHLQDVIHYAEEAGECGAEIERLQELVDQQQAANELLGRESLIKVRELQDRVEALEAYIYQRYQERP